jgi:hypothetical protein
MDTEDAKVTCVATNRAGTQCQRRPIAGGTVCPMHGGKAPQVVAKAKERLLFAADPAARVLITLLKSDDDRVKHRAAEAILDRAGIPRRTELTGPEGEAIPVEVRATKLVEAIEELRRRQSEEESGG